MNKTISVAGLLLAALLPCHATAVSSSDPLVERGRYLVKMGGCNDCHTADYVSRNGAVPEKDWLQGDTIGWRGPWGTTYAVNLRLYMEPFSEDQWLVVARNKPARPPMPWYALRDMSDDDLRALYRYIRYLGPAGVSAPSYVPPDDEPTTAYISFVPITPGAKPAPAGKAEADKKGSFWDFDFKPAPPRTERP
jgi:mono/diheme cytochrome c family protein